MPPPKRTPDAPLTPSEIFAQLPQARLEDGGYVVGEPDAPITIIEFADYACPHCQDYRPVIDQIIADYVATGQAKFELRIFPTAGGVKTYAVGKLLECAEAQRTGAFWAAYDLLYQWAIPGDYDGNVPRLLATNLDVSYDKMIACIDTAQQVDADIAFGEANGVTGTPAVLVSYGDAVPEFITLDDVTYDRGGVSYEVLARVIEDANGGALPNLTPTEETTPALMVRGAATGAF